MTALYLVIPCYNEEEVLPETARRLLDKLDTLQRRGAIGDKSRILFVDDGSRDRTWALIRGLAKQDSRFGGVKLSRNRGHQNALLAGLTVAKQHCDAVISLDADLQDDINAIDQMLEQYAQGIDVVYGVRSARTTDTAFKRGTAHLFYKLMQGLGVDIVDDHADYRLLSRRALEGLMQYGEANLFLRGIVPLVGFSSAIVTYERHERFAGTSKYPLKKMLLFALDGITAFSTRPIRLVLLAGVLIFGCSLLTLLLLLLQKLMGYTVQGWTTLMGSIWLLGGLQLLGLGIVGEYVGRVYQETKHRPRFIIEEVLPPQ